MGKITRAMVLQGTELRHVVDIPQWNKEATLTVKPITDGQFMEIQAKMFEGVELGEDNEPFKGMTMTEISQREKNVRRQAVAFALSIDGEEWAPEDVALLPPGAVDALYNDVALISGFPKGRRAQAPPLEELDEVEQLEPSEEPESLLTK